ncbi:MAG: alpha/beta hydrolase-fold protein [Chthoniobacteraceae bacterium]
MKYLSTFVAALGLTALSTFAQNPAPRPEPIVSPELAEGRVTFRLRAPQAKEVALRGQWSKAAVPMTRAESGTWTATVEPAPAGVWEYSFVVDGLNVIDPTNPALKPQREPQKSILHVPSDPPAVWDWQDVPHGTVHQHGYASKALGKPRECWVYTPPGYEKTTEKFPLLVLQHGSGDNSRAWVEHGKAHWILDNLIAAKKARPMIVVMLDGHPLGAWPRGDEGKRAAAMEAFQRELFEDALPLVESLYRVEMDRSQRAIAGLSMGGAQSLTVGIGNLDRFAWIGSFSGVAPEGEVREKFLAAPDIANAKLRLLWIAVGKDDFLRQRNEDFIAALKEKGIRHEWQLTAGDHSWPVWRRYLAEFAPLLFTEAK